MRFSTRDRPVTALIIAGLLVVSTLIIVQFANLKTPSAGPPSGGEQGSGGSEGNNTSANSPGGRLVARVLQSQVPSGPLEPVRGVRIEIDSNVSIELARPRSVHVVTNLKGYAFATLVPGPYILSASQEGWELIGVFNITKGRTTDFNITATEVSLPVSSYDIEDPDSSMTLGPWATLAVNIPKETTLALNQTVFFVASSSTQSQVQLGSVVLPYTNATGSPAPFNLTVTQEIRAVVAGDYQSLAGRWVALRPLDALALSQFYETDLLVYQAAYQTGLEPI